MKYNIEVSSSDFDLLIKFDGITHLRVSLAQLVGIQSWIQGKNNKKYIIEYSTKTTTIQSEYDDRNKWEQILAELDKLEIFD
jgi:hypothetical protein